MYATVRRERDVDAVKEIKNVVPFLIDVRDPLQIQAAFEQVKSAGFGLYRLINNAGVGDIGMLSTWTEDELYNIFNINVFGPHRMTNAFLPYCSNLADVSSISARKAECSS